MTPRLKKGYSVPSMTILFLNLQIIRSDIRPHIKWAVSLVIAYGDFNLPQGIVSVCMSSHTHFITPKGTDDTPDETHVILFFSKCIRHVFMPIRNNYHAQNIEIWRPNIESHDLISACNVWWHVSPTDVKTTLYLDVENAPNLARIHFEKTKITFT